MNTNPAAVPGATPVDVWLLDRQSILVKPAHSSENPVTGVRGTIRVVPGKTPVGEPRVELVIHYPEMFSQQRRERVISLDHDQVRQLLAAANRESYEFIYDGDLGPAF